MPKVFAVSLLLLLTVAGARTQTAPVPAPAAKAEIRELAPGVYLWPGDRDRRQPANCTWVIFRDYVVVLDANFPWGAREILEKIRSTTNKPIRYVFNTHYHGDHSYGNSIFTDLRATIITSEATAREMRTRGASGWNNWNDKAHSLEGAHLEPASITFGDRMVLDDGTQRVEFIRVGPGHTNGDSVAYLPRYKIVTTGDLCVTWGFGNNVADAAADYDNWLRVLDQIAGWDLATVVPGHGLVSTVAALHTQHDYLADMMAQVKAGIAAGKTAEALSASIDLSRHGLIANDAAANATSIRAMYQRFTAK